MLHSKSCACCGCQKLGIIRVAPASTAGAAAWFNETQPIHQRDDALSDGEGPTVVEVISPTWVNATNGSRVGRGGVKVDLDAHYVAAKALWRANDSEGSPGWSAQYRYDDPYTPTLMSSCTVSLHDSVQATCTLGLTARTINGVLDKLPIGADYVADLAMFDLYNIPVSASYRMTIDGYRTLVPSYGDMETPLSQFWEWSYFGMASWVLAHENTSLAGPTFGSEQGHQGFSIGRNPTVSAPFWGYSYAPPPSQPYFGYDATVTLTGPGGSVAVVSRRPLDNRAPPYSGEPIGTGVFVESTQEGPTMAVAIIAALGNVNDEAGEASAFVTAFMSRRYSGMFANALGGGMASRRVKITRGASEVVLDAVNPSAATINAAKAQDGAYFTEISSLTPIQNDQPALVASAEWLTTFESSVVDHRTPVFGPRPVDDLYVGYSFPFSHIVWSTAPMQVPNVGFGGGSLLSPSVWDEDLPLPRPSTIFALSWGGAESGTQTLGPRQFSLWGAASDWKDIYGNAATALYSHTWKRHPLAEAYQPHVVATLEDPGLQTREHHRLRLQSEPVQELRLRFDRKIDPATVQQSQIKLFQGIGTSMVSVGGVTLEPVEDGSREWSVRVTAAQPERAYFILEYDPNGEVKSDDFVTVPCIDREQFPPYSKARRRVVYVDESTQRRYSMGPAGATDFVDIGRGNPLRPDGQQYYKDKCVLARRVGWLMADMAGPYRAPDASASDPIEIGRIASVGQAMTVSQFTDASRVASTGDCFLAHSLGEYSPLRTGSTYTPCVPQPDAPDQTYSYWGLTTTIYPSPPKDIGACAAPNAQQPHSSIVIGKTDIGTLKVSFRNATSFDYSTYKFSDHQGSGSFLNRNADFAIGGTSATRVAYRLLSMSGDELSFGTAAPFGNMPQNAWAHVSAARSQVVPITESKPPPDLTCNGVEYYAVTCTRNGDHESEANWTPLSPPVRRTITGGTIKIAAIQGMAYVSRLARTYAGLKTATLSRLAVNVNMRVVLECEVNYEDKEIARDYWRNQGHPVGFIYWPASYQPCYQGTFAEVAEIAKTNPYFWNNPDRIVYRGTWANSSAVASRTLTHHVLTDLGFTGFLTSDGEAALAAGQPVEFTVVSGQAGFIATLRAQ